MDNGQIEHQHVNVSSIKNLFPQHEFSLKFKLNSIINVAVDCGQPESPDPNGAISVGETTLGNTATYSCNSGFDLVGSSTVTCLASGQWSDGAPTCQRKNK